MSSTSYHFTIQTLHNWSQEKLSDIQNQFKQVASSTGTTVSFSAPTNAFKVKGSSYEKVDLATRQILKKIRVIQRQEKRAHSVKQNTIAPLYSFTGQRTLQHQSTEELLSYRQDLQVSNEPNHEKHCRGSFVFHPDINPLKLLASHGDINFLEEITSLTKTTALLEDQTITVTGQSPESIEQALTRFKNLENRALQAPYQNKLVTLVHYPYVKDRFKLYFVSYSTVGVDLGFSFTSKYSLSNIHLLLPVIENHLTGLWSRPSNIYLSSLNKIIDHENQQTTNSLLSTESGLKDSVPVAKIHWKEIENFDPMDIGECSTNTTLTSQAISELKQLDSNSEDLDLMSLDPSTSNHDTTSESERSYQVIKDEPESCNKAPEALHNFSKNGGLPEPQNPPGKILKDYNFTQIKSTFHNGLEHVRYFQGEVSIEARLGKVAYGDLKSNALSKLWEYSDLNEILLDGMKFKPIFSNIVALEYSAITRIIDRLGTGHSRHPSYVIEADVRSDPNGHYSPVRLHINANMANLEKVVTKKNHVLDINWNSLSRIYDFQLKIWTRKLLRHDTKPYTNFLKNISINPSDLRIVYKHGDHYIRVKRIKLKRKRFYKIDDQFTLELTLVTILHPSMNLCGRMEADPSKGKSYFTVRVSNRMWDSRTRHNISLRPGDVPPWSVDELVGGSTCRHLVRFIRTMIILAERAQEHKQSQQ